MENFVETYKVIPVMAPVDASTSGLTTEWISMKKAAKATFILYAGVLGASANAVTLNVADDASGTHSATSKSSMDLTLPYYWKSGVTAAASCDVYAKTTVSSSTFNIGASSDGKVVIVEVEASKMGTFTSTSVYDADYVRLAVTTQAGDFLSCVCILTGYRYKEDAPTTDLA